MNRHKKTKSIQKKMAVQLFLLVLTFLGAITAAFIITDMHGYLSRTAYEMLDHNVSLQASRLSSQMNIVALDAQSFAKSLETKIGLIGTAGDIKAGGAGIISEILRLSADEITAEVFGKSRVTGAFVVLTEGYRGIEGSRASVYLRNSSPEASYITNSMVTMCYGPYTIARDKNIALDYIWEHEMSFSGKDAVFYTDFYDKPVKMGTERPELGAKLLGYWSPAFSLAHGGKEVITYTLPLFDSGNNVIGITGFELSADYIIKNMITASIPYENSFYLITRMNDEGISSKEAIYSGAYAQSFLFGQPDRIPASPHSSINGSIIYTAQTAAKPTTTLLGSIHTVDIYYKDSPYYSENMVIAGMTSENVALMGARMILILELIVLALLLVLGIAAALLISKSFAAPIIDLSRQVINMDPHKPVRFKKVNIKEIDELSASFELMNDEVIYAASRMSKIIDMVDAPVGGFEINLKQGIVILTDSTIRMLGLHDAEEGRIPLLRWLDLLEGEDFDMDEGKKTVTLKNSEPTIYLKLQYTKVDSRIIGTLIDVSGDTYQRQLLEYERDSDHMTKLLNRNAFSIKGQAMLSETDKAALVFADLDNLKFINDNYGHEAGDRYIKEMARCFSTFEKHGGIAARLSGDEFAALICCGENDRDIREIIYRGLERFRSAAISLGDGSNYTLKFSAGVSYYPKHSGSIEELIRYADFAMYKIKHSDNKGSTGDFDFDLYKEDNIYIKNNECLSRFLNDKRLSFTACPVIELQSGQLFGYDVKMVPKLRENISESEIFKIAGSLNMLYDVQMLIMRELLDWYKDKKGSCMKFFVSSAGTLSDRDWNELGFGYKDTAKDFVFRFAGIKESQDESVFPEINAIHSRGSMIEIDNTDARYLDEASLSVMNPDFLSLDESFLSGIKNSANKRGAVSDIISFARAAGLKTIARGVSDSGDLKTLTKLGIDYASGSASALPHIQH